MIKHPHLLRDGDVITLKGVYRANEGVPQVLVGFQNLDFDTSVQANVADITHLFHPGDEVRSPDGKGIIAQGVDRQGQKVPDNEPAFAYLVDIKHDPYQEIGATARPEGLAIIPPGKLSLLNRAPKIDMDID